MQSQEQALFPPPALDRQEEGFFFGEKCALRAPILPLAIPHAAASSPQGVPAGPSTQHAACGYAVRCVCLCSALHRRPQRTAFSEAKCSGDFQGAKEHSVVGTPQPYPEGFAVGCIIFRSYTKPPQDTWANCCAQFHACKEPTERRASPLAPLYSNRRHTASPPPASAHGEVGRGLPMGREYTLMLRAQRPRRPRAAPRRSRSRRSPPAGHTTG